MGCPKRYVSATGFSLLEVILATSIIAASSMVLLQLISTGQQHQLRGERQAIAQMICQSRIDELAIYPERAQSVELQRVREFPDWVCTIEVASTEYDGLIRVRIRAAEFPADVDEPVTTDPRYDFELVRWLRSPTSDDPNQVSAEALP